MTWRPYHIVFSTHVIPFCYAALCICIFICTCATTSQLAAWSLLLGPGKWAFATLHLDQSVMCYAGPLTALVKRLRRGHLRSLHPCYSVYTHSLTTTDTGSILPCTVANRSGISPSHNSIRCRSVSKGLMLLIDYVIYISYIILLTGMSR
jgi:hypothetical protein